MFKTVLDLLASKTTAVTFLSSQHCDKLIVCTLYRAFYIYGTYYIVHCK